MRRLLFSQGVAIMIGWTLYAGGVSRFRVLCGPRYFWNIERGFRSNASVWRWPAMNEWNSDY